MANRQSAGGDRHSKEYYNRWRYYSPGAGTYSTMDPLGLHPSTRPTAYPEDPWSEKGRCAGRSPPFSRLTDNARNPCVDLLRLTPRRRYLERMRRGTCVKCGGQRIRHLEHVIDPLGRGAWSTRYANQEYRALGAAQRSTGLLSTETSLAAVEAFACAACGYFEEYVKDPAQVPWEELPLSRWV